MIIGTPSTDNKQIARAAGIVMLAFVISNLIGLIRGIVITRAFGTNADLDAFNAASRVTELLFNLVAGGAMASAFVPTFTGLLSHDDRHGAWQLASSIINLVLLVLIALSVFAYIFAPQIVEKGLYFLAPGTVVTQQQLTVDLLRLMLPSVIIFGISGLLMGILNAHQIFLIPAIAPSMYSLGMIAGTIFLSPMMGISGLAWGVVIGAAGHFLLQIPSILRLNGKKYHFKLGLDNPVVIEVLRLMTPRLLGVAVVQLNFIVNTVIALGLPEGSVTALVLGFGLMMMPQMAIAQSTGIAALPTFSTQAAQGRHTQLSNSISVTLRWIILLSMPASLGLILLRQPIVAFLYQRGEFSEYSTSLVAWALAWYAAGLVGHSILEVISRAFYALHDTRTPVAVGVIAMSLNIGLSFALSSFFRSVGWMPHGGLALANSLATAVEVVVLLVILYKRLGYIGGRSVFSAVCQSIIGGLGMVVVLVVWNYFMSADSLTLHALGGIILGGFVYSLILWVLRVPEMGQMAGIIKRKLLKSL
ncbi:MAG: murein biosynthesis integral membrane protein MurJ [Anaerolineaceae bacterium]|nr:murein biosynthesis integral membrane protein MurJ [Anaerolineaceae bacterium]